MFATCKRDPLVVLYRWLDAGGMLACAVRTTLRRRLAACKQSWSMTSPFGGILKARNRGGGAAPHSPLSSPKS